MSFNIDFGGLTRTGFVIDFGLGGGAGSTGQVKVWLASWMAKPIKVWNGSAWVVKPLKRWNGSSWVITPY